MTPLPTPSKTLEAPAADSALGFLSPAEPVADGNNFEKVFREAAHEAENAEQEKAAEAAQKKKATEEKATEEQQSKAAADKAKAEAKVIVVFGQGTVPQPDPARQAQAKAAVKAGLANGEKANTPKLDGQEMAKEPKLPKLKVADQSAENQEAKSERAQADRKTLQARQQAAAKQASRLKKQQAARAQLKAEDAKHASAKAQLEEAQQARQNLPTSAVMKGAQAKAAQTAGKTGNLPEGQWEMVKENVNGTQIAQHNPKMAMMAKTPSPAPEGSVARWEELRPATSAELGGGASSQQQDLPREQAREFTAPVQAVATPAATGTSATQAFTPVPGQISATLEKIWNAVTTFRAKGVDQWTVKLQAENQQMELTIRYRQGGLEIQARLGQSDGQQLANHWNELQQSLAERGVTLRDLERQEAENARFSEDLDDFNSAQSRRHAPAGEEDEDPLNWGGPNLDQDEEEQPAPSRAPARAADANWESWA